MGTSHHNVNKKPFRWFEYKPYIQNNNNNGNSTQPYSNISSKEKGYLLPLSIEQCANLEKQLNLNNEGLSTKYFFKYDYNDKLLTVKKNDHIFKRLKTPVIFKNNNSYKIINEKYIEYCDIDSYYGFKDKKQYSSQLFSLDSKILLNYGEFDFIVNYLKTKFNKQIISSIRIYRATEDGDKAETFHRLCDGNTNIIILIKTKDGKKFGGFTSIGFSNINQSVLDETAFVFSINKREIYPNKKGQKAVESHKNLGPTFSGDIIKIYDNFLKSGGITSRKGLNYHTTEDFQINDGNKYFYVEEIEVLEFLEMKVE